MAQPLRSMNPTTPFGRERNTLLGTDLRDPNAFLAQLVARNAAVSAPAASKPKQAQPQPQAQPATPPSTPTPPAPQPPQSRPTPQLATSFEAQRKAARDAYDAELAGFSQRSQQGNQVTPLEQKRALQRYNNELGRLYAIENRGIRKKRGEQLRTERLDREDYANERAAATLDESTKRLTSMFDSTPKPPAVNIPSSAGRAAMSAQMAANDAQRAAADRLPAPATPAPTQPGWLDNAITRTINLLQSQMSRTPTAQLSSVAAPSQSPPAPVAEAPSAPPLLSNSPPAPSAPFLLSNPPSAPAAEEPFQMAPSAPPPAPPYGLDPGVNQVISNLYAGNVSQGNMGIDQLGEMMRGATPQQLAALYDGLQALPPEQQKATLRQMIEQNQQLNVNLGQPQKITPEQAAQIERLNPPASFFSMDALDDLARGFTDLTQNPVLQTIAGPGGLLGTALPPDAIARERAMATTPEQLRMIQAREAQAGMQGALLDLAGAGFATRPSITPSPARPQVAADIRRIVGQTPTTTTPTSNLPFQLDAGWQTPNSPRQAPPTTAGAGAFMTPEAPVTMRPGSPGIEVGPVPQPRPFVPEPETGMGPPQTPIVNPGSPRYRELRPSRQDIQQHMIENPDAGAGLGAPRRRPTPDSRGIVPVRPSAAIEAAARRANAPEPVRPTVNDLNAFNAQRTNQIIDDLGRLGVLPDQNATSTPEAKPAPAPEAALAEVAKPATPAPAPTPAAAAEAPVPLAEPTGTTVGRTTVGRNTVQATTVTPRATPAPGQKAPTRAPIIEALKAYGTKVVEDTRALLAKDRKGTVTDSDVLTYLKDLTPEQIKQIPSQIKALLPGKAGTAK